CEVEALMKPGTSALFVLDQEGDMESILQGIRGLGGTVLKTNVDVERARLVQTTLVATSAMQIDERRETEHEDPLSPRGSARRATRASRSGSAGGACHQVGGRGSGHPPYRGQRFLLGSFPLWSLDDPGCLCGGIHRQRRPRNGFRPDRPYPRPGKR